jgi:hypothetical protein
MPLLIRIIDGKNVVNTLATINEKMKDNKVIVARFALG